MRKRRVFALLLALSLAVSPNTMTVLAAEQGTEIPAGVFQEEILENGSEEPEESIEEGENPGVMEGTPETDGISEEEKEPSAGEDVSGEEEKPEDGSQSEEDSKPEDGGQSGENGKPEDGGQPGEDSKPEDGSMSGEEDPSASVEEPGQEEEQVPSVEEETGEDQPTAEDGIKEKPEKPKKTETAAPAPAASVKSVPAARPYVSRIVTFTDDTGMLVSYDANASQEYIYKVENGVLKAVVTKTMKPAGSVSDNTVSGNTVSGNTVSGNTVGGDMVEVEVPVKFEGNVELKQPEEGEHYTSIAPGVFGGNQDITYVKLPAGLTTIAEDNFKGCTSLKSVYLPPSVTKIEAGAFENCTSMTQISVPKTVTEIGDRAFRNDLRLHLVYIKDKDYAELETIGANAFEGCAVLSEFCTDTGFDLPNRLKSIGAAAFKGCRSIKEIDFSNTKLSEMGESAFEACTGLVDLTMGKNLPLIPKRAFADCSALALVTFPVVGGVNMTIEGYAFSGCYNIKQIVFPQSVTQIKNYAFLNCTKLKRVEIRNDNIILEEFALPVGNEDFVIIATPSSTGDDYAAEHGVQADEKRYYKYTVEDVDGATVADGKFPGGTIWVGTAEQNKYENNINTLNKKQGVQSDTTTKYYIYQENKEGYTFIWESLRCNGKPMQKDDAGKYYFYMPEGGVVITAEFRSNTPDKIKGQKVSVEFSTGEYLQDGRQDPFGYLGVELKVGQTTRMYVMDEDGEPIPAAKLKLTSRDKNVATVNSQGVITATGTGGKPMAGVEIDVVVNGGDGNPIQFSRTISVKSSEAKSIILTAADYREQQVKIEGEKSGIQTAFIKQNFVKAKELKFTLRASVYDGVDRISKDLEWSTSDSSVAVLANSKTKANSPENEVTVKKGCDGQTTIKVTAKNSSSAEKEEITQKFVIRVYQDGCILTPSSVTVNPNQKNSGVVELIPTGGPEVDVEEIRLYQVDSKANTPFFVDYDAEGSKKNCKRFYINPTGASIQDGTYKVRVGLGEDTNEKNFFNLSIIVKRETPKPTVKFNSKKTKFNLFYKNGGTDADGNPIVVTTEITKLGRNRIREVKLEPLTEKENDRKFTKNFEIDQAATDLSKGTVVIRRSAGSLEYTSAKKPAVTGYLTVYYEGYEDSAAKKIKVTMPNCTTAPSYALRETKVVYSADCFEKQNEVLEVYDKKSKTKEKVDLEGCTVKSDLDELSVEKDTLRIENGAIAFSFWPAVGKMKLILGNEDWDLDKNGKPRTLTFTYSVSISDKKPTMKTGTVNYPEKDTFTLTANQKGLKIAGEQKFYPKSSSPEIDKFVVTYENGKGHVSVKSGVTVKKGTYKFGCDPRVEEWPDVNAVTLTVKVVDTVKLGKGSLQLNLTAFRQNSAVIESVSDNSMKEEYRKEYQETAEIPFTVKGLPDGAVLADVGTGSQDTKMECTRGQSVGNHFTFHVTEGNLKEKIDHRLSVSLKDSSVGTGTYTFRMTLAYQVGEKTVYTTPVNVKVKVYSDAKIGLKVAAKGKINLVNREGEADEKNGIIYTPTLQKLAGQITDVKIYDTPGFEEESERFDIELITEGKNKGKFFVTPKKTVKAEDGKAKEYEYAELLDKRDYPVYIWAKVKGYGGVTGTNGGVVSERIKIKTSQVLPKVTTDKSTLDVYLIGGSSGATFMVAPQENAVGKIEDVYFAGDTVADKTARDSLTLTTEPQQDGSIKVIVHMQKGAEYKKDDVSDVKMYVKYKGQGTNTSKTATPFTMKIRVN